MAELPGDPLPSGFDFRERDPLSPEALERIRAKIESVQAARRRAMADASSYVIGAAATATSGAFERPDRGMTYEPGTVAVFRVPEPAPVHPDGGRGLLVGVVAGVHEENGRIWVNLIACHSTPEMATDNDVVVHGATPYPLVLMGECYAQAWTTQITRVVGRVPVEAVRAAWVAIHDDGEAAERWNDDGRPTLPLAGPSDPRWRWLEEWLPALTALSSPVRRVVLG